MAPLPIRPRTERDLPGVGALFVASHHRDAYPVVLLEDMDAWGAGGADPIDAWVAVDSADDTQVLGHVILVDADPDEEATGQWTTATGLPPAELAVVRRLVVDDRAKGTGTGAALLATAVQAAHALGRRPVLDMADNLHAAGRLYERAGFELIGHYDLDLRPFMLPGQDSFEIHGTRTHVLRVLTWIGPAARVGDRTCRTWSQAEVGAGVRSGDSGPGGAAVGAGDSAAAESERARQAAARLRRKAANAEHIADNYAKGELGERMVAAATAPLEARGWRILHDRQHPDGGNIDHIAIGPPGVAILDAKNWTSPVTITPDRRLAQSKYDRTENVDKLDATIALVRSILQGDGVRVAVRGCMVLTGDADRRFAVRDLGDVRVLGVDGLQAELLRARGDLDPEMIDAIAATLATELPEQGAPARSVEVARAAASPGPAGPSAAFQKAQRFFYLNRWKKAGHDRYYLRNAHGDRLGWTDLNTGATTIECTGDDARFAEVLLAAADPGGIKVEPGEMPKVPTRLFGGRLLSKFARFHTSVLVGIEWRAFGKHRLYGTLIDPAFDTWDLGYVDLKTGSVHPEVEGDLSNERGPAARYLEYLHHELPARPTA